MHLNAIGNRNVSYNQESFVTAYYDVLIHGLTITKAGYQHLDRFYFLKFLICKIFSSFLWVYCAENPHLGCYEASDSSKDSGILRERKGNSWFLSKNGTSASNRACTIHPRRKKSGWNSVEGAYVCLFIFDLKYNYFHLLLLLL